MTVDLPDALRPWRSELALFPGELAAALGAVIARVSLLVGPLERSGTSALGELDGVTGITRRGPFERLLAAEWALLDAWPDEFMRRAASRELAFYDMARREPRDDRRSIALFDAGVTQLGGPRVVHVAALVLLHARARDAGADFAWGIAQDPECRLFAELTRSSILALVNSRFDARATQTDLFRWRVALTANAKRTPRPVELWVVGDSEAVDAAAGIHARGLVVEDSLDPERRGWVLVSVRAPGHSPRSAELPLPPAPVCVRLLRDPFAVTAPRPSPAPRLKRRFVFGAGGRSLFAQTSAGALVTFAVPNSPKAARVEPAIWTPPKGQTMLAVGRQRGGRARTLVITSSAEGLHLHELARAHRSTYRASRLTAEVDDLPTTATGLALLCIASDGRAFFLDGERVLRIENGAVHEGAPWRAIAIRAGETEPEALTADAGTRLMRYGRGTWSEASAVPLRAEAANAPALFGYRGALAVRAAEGVWRARAGARPDRLIPAGENVVAGVMVEDDDPLLLVVNPREQCIDLVRPGGARKRSIHVGSPIASAQASEHGSSIAVITGESLVVYDLAGRACATYLLEGVA